MEKFHNDLLACIICSIIFGAIVCFGFSKIDHKSNTEIHTSETVDMGEWISPDGVHYWYRKNGNLGFLAPRYDENGDLVIDK